MDAKIERDNFEKLTRSVFDQHHREQAADNLLFERLTSLISTEYFHIPPDYFKGKNVFDMGCGSNANASYAFLSLGAKRVYSADIGKDWMNCAYEKLQEFGNKSVLVSEDVLDLTFEDNYFDFVHCAGVLHHTIDPKKGFMELGRVTKVGGLNFITIMATAEGIIYICINRLREKYKEDEKLRYVIDNLNIELLQNKVEWILSEKNKYEGCSEEEKKFIKSLFDNDFILTIKDRLQAPTYNNFDFNEKQIRSWFEEAGFTDIKRLSRYTKGFNNLRKYLAPLYYHYDAPLARFLFGEGYIQMIGVKK